MKVIVIYKKSSLTLAGEMTGDHPNTARFKVNHKTHYESLSKVEESLRRSGLHYHKKCRSPKNDLSAYDLVITVGGDGTLLEAGRSMTSRQLLLGVNSDPAWSVGQFARASANNFDLFLQKIAAGKAVTHRLHKLLVRLSLKSVQEPIVAECLNDILVCHADPASMSRYELRIGRIKEEHRNSGIWFASGAGSTGAIMSAGGKKMNEESREVQYHQREPYRTKGMRYRLHKGTFPTGTKAQLTSFMTKGCLCLDGSHVRYRLTNGDTAIISSSSRYIRLVHA